MRATLPRSRRCATNRPKPSRWERLGPRRTAAHRGTYFSAYAHWRLGGSLALPDNASPSRNAFGNPSNALACAEAHGRHPREGDAPAEPPVCNQPPKTVPLGNDWHTPERCPSGQLFSGVCTPAARREPRPPGYRHAPSSLRSRLRLPDFTGRNCGRHESRSRRSGRRAGSRGGTPTGRGTRRGSSSRREGHGTRPRPTAAPMDPRDRIRRLRHTHRTNRNTIPKDYRACRTAPSRLATCHRLVHSRPTETRRISATVPGRYRRRNLSWFQRGTRIPIRPPSAVGSLCRS